MTRILVFVACALASMLVLAGTLYKSVGPDGKISYSDQPPRLGQVLMTKTFEVGPSTSLPPAAAEQLERMKSAKTVAAPTDGVVLYSAAWCGYCQKAKTYLADKRIPYREVDIDTKDGLATFAQVGGGKGVPLLTAGTQRVQGFSVAAYDAFFANNK
ncbi:MAG: glutaredoxin family protein [Gammaproteobacteria bacterium]|nr:glutaredoxin family protein [Rhodocyclaceae bacterium]MBU3910796.1 glutaredoxin family protein [Gammaproteobacteria bacterium]MBU3987778.1 glutaredoxin family protein [Gammaproteobacteria bacterium]MBU4006250.1 glutaredoxin family protein [Gammaproteobacteria bacterium]MBU4097857.1 glutaredoxin family protein [Gammaproteobacteria bacterium]